MASSLPPYCPHLGLEEDRSSNFSYPADAHRCFVSGEAVSIELEHQEEFCLGTNHPACPDFEVPEATSLPTASADRALEPLQHEERVEEAAETTEGEYWEGVPFWGFSPLRIALWAVAGVMAILTLVYYGSSVFLVPPTPEPPVAAFQNPTPTATATASPVITPAQTPFQFLRPTSTPTPPLGGEIYDLSPAASAVGWVASSEERGNHFGDSHIYVGIYGGNIYHGAVQFDLSVVPKGAPIYSAIVQLTGLSEERLGASSSWELRMLEADADADWPSHTYQDIHNFKVEQTIPPVLGNADLGRNKINVFTLTAKQRATLEERVLETGRVSFRLDGSLSGRNDLFAWDTGYGSESLGAKPVLILSVGPPPSEPISPRYVVVTSTPTPENVLTAMAMAVTATARATMIGTPTRMPANVATATPLIVVTSTPTPENAATATAMVVWATAVAMTTGEPTPTPPNVVTATPTPTSVLITSVPTPENVLTAAAVTAIATVRAATDGTPTPPQPNWVTPIVVTSTPTPENAATAQLMAAMATARAFTTGTPTPTPPNVVTATPIPPFVLITSVPTPENVLTAAAVAATATVRAATDGTPTPLPSNWVTPIVVTSTPTPENAATAQFMAAIATARAFTTGTPTPTPPNMVTPTPTPALIYVDDPTLTPQPTPTPTADPARMPPELKGKIAFLSDREGEESTVYVMDPDGSNVAKLTDPWAYELALDLDTYSPDMSQQVFAYKWKSSHELWVRNTADGWMWCLRALAEGEPHGKRFQPEAYQPAWSPDSVHIAYVSQEDGNDEIHVIDLRKEKAVAFDTRLTQNNWEWDKHPSYSPDGRQIVFWSNRESGRGQIWIMYADGSQQQNISNNPYNDWDPVWIKWPKDISSP